MLALNSSAYMVLYIADMNARSIGPSGIFKILIVHQLFAFLVNLLSCMSATSILYLSRNTLSSSILVLSPSAFHCRIRSGLQSLDMGSLLTLIGVSDRLPSSGGWTQRGHSQLPLLVAESILVRVFSSEQSRVLWLTFLHV